MLAIVIPYFKIDFFEETLGSLAKQTDKRFHVYIGDDASPHSPEVLLNKYQGKFNFTYKRFENNLGSVSLVKQWERCIDMMQDEEWFMILGDDDLLGNNVVEEFYKNIKIIEIKTTVVRFSSILINENNEVLLEKSIHPLFENAINSYIRKIQGKNRSTLSEYFFCTEKYKKIKFKDYYSAWSSDDRAIIDFSDNRDVFSINEAIIFVRLSKINISGNDNDLLKKQLAHLKCTRDLILDYYFVFKKNQKKIIIDYYYHQIFSIPKNKFFDEFFLIILFFLNKQNKQTLNLLKSIIKKYLNGKK